MMSAAMLARFEAVVTGDSVTRGKPDPEPYLEAMAALRIDPDQGIAIENAPYGITSARAAGLFCVAISTSLPESYLHEADRIVTDHEALRTFLLGT